MDINDSRKVNLDSQVLTTVYRHYKENILPIGIILVCIGIIFFVIVPEFNNYLKSKEELKIETQKLDVLKNNYNFLLSLDDSKADNDFKKLSLALPPNKDFVGIMSAITLSASKTGVSVEDFNFSLGDLDKVTQDSSQFPSIKIEINLGGNAQAITKFITQLYKTAPTAEVSIIKTTGNSSTLTIIFFYKPFPPQNVSDENPVVPISESQKLLIEEVSSWNSSNLDVFLPDVTASSGGTNPSPF